MTEDVENIAVVDDANRFIRWASRDEVHRDRLLHRSVYVALFNGAGALTVQRRHRQKQTYPGYWDMSCSGHVEGEDYLGGPDDRLEEVFLAVAARELEEELGVRTPLEHLGYFGPEPSVHYEVFHFYQGRSDAELTLQATEVEAVCHVGLDEFDAFVAREAGRVTPSLVYLMRWYRASGLTPPVR